MYWRILSRPIGVTRLTQTLLAVIAFVITVDVGGYFEFRVDCPSAAVSYQYDEMVKWKYPFWLSSIMIESGRCNTSSIVPLGKEQMFFLDFAHPAQFFVFVGVTSFMLSLLTLTVYIGLWHEYSASKVVPILDFIFAVVVSMLWLTASCSWASTYQILTTYMSQEGIQRSLSLLPTCQTNSVCTLTNMKDHFAAGKFSVIIGFINWLFWTANGTQIYREVRRLKHERERLLFTEDAFCARATPAETMDTSMVVNGSRRVANNIYV